jgi:prolyl-tRNA synthetase
MGLVTHPSLARKYRDELRPRHGLLRSREFVMKDLYTFDYNASLALATYHEVRDVYAQLFDELKIPYLVAEADSGDMGGNLSHEFHFPTSRGEDHIISCKTCNYVANEELAEIPALPGTNGETESDMHLCGEQNIQTQSDRELSTGVKVWRGISRDRSTLVNVWYLSPVLGTDPSLPALEPEVNVYAVKAVIPELDASIGDPVPFWNTHAQSPLGTHSTPGRPRRLMNLVDYRVPSHVSRCLGSRNSHFPLWPISKAGPLPDIEIETLSVDHATQRQLNLLRVKDGDACPRCSDGTLLVRKAIELGHTFHLGTRYSGPLKATVSVPAYLLGDEETDTRNTRSGSSEARQVNMQMGCHGIGVSRMIGAVADTLADEKGLNWPRVIAPFEVVIVPGKGLEEAALKVYDALSAVQPSSDGARLDIVLDDRIESFPWKMQDADLVGYPVIVVVGRRWKTEKICEVQCRRLGVREEVLFKGLLNFIQCLLVNL